MIRRWSRQRSLSLDYLKYEFKGKCDFMGGNLPDPCIRGDECKKFRLFWHKSSNSGPHITIKFVLESVHLQIKYAESEWGDRILNAGSQPKKENNGFSGLTWQNALQQRIMHNDRKSIIRKKTYWSESLKMTDKSVTILVITSS